MTTYICPWPCFIIALLNACVFSQLVSSPRVELGTFTAVPLVAGLWPYVLWMSSWDSRKSWSALLSTFVGKNFLSSVLGLLWGWLAGKEWRWGGRAQWALGPWQRGTFYYLIVEQLGRGRVDKFRICLEDWEKEKYERKENQRVLL